MNERIRTQIARYYAWSRRYPALLRTTIGKAMSRIQTQPQHLTRDGFTLATVGGAYTRRATAFAWAGLDQLPSAFEQYRRLTEDAFAQADSTCVGVEQEQGGRMLATPLRCATGQLGARPLRLLTVIVVAVTQGAVEVLRIAHQRQRRDRLEGSAGAA